MTDYINANRENWNDRASAHATRTGVGYRVQRYIDDRRLISDVVRFDLDRLGAVDGLRTVHLQCHIGTDTLSLARLGARVTGLDFSPVALEEARSSWRRPATTSISSRPMSIRRCRCSSRGASTSSTRASAPSAGCPVSSAGPRWSRVC